MLLLSISFQAYLHELKKKPYLFIIHGAGSLLLCGLSSLQTAYTPHYSPAAWVYRLLLVVASLVEHKV